MTVCVEVEVEAFDEADAVETIEDAFGEGDYGSYETNSLKITGIREV